MKKINQYKRTYYKEQGAAIAIAFVGFLFYCNLAQAEEELKYIRHTETTVSVEIVQEKVEDPVQVTVTTAVTATTSEKDVIVSKIRAYFPKNADTMVAIAKAESRLDHTAKGYNCYYNKTIYNKDGTVKTEAGTVVYESWNKNVYSTHCKVPHRKYAYSVDCGVLQKNYKGQQCPEMDLDDHLQVVRDLSLVQGLEAWSAYNNGSYKKYLTKN